MFCRDFPEPDFSSFDTRTFPSGDSSGNSIRAAGFGKRGSSRFSCRVAGRPRVAYDFRPGRPGHEGMKKGMSIETYETLFAEGGGLCANPGCGADLFEPAATRFAGGIFRVDEDPGEGSGSVSENLDSPENLVLLCCACGGEAESGSLAPGELGRWKRELGSRSSAEVPGELSRVLRERETERETEALRKFRFFRESGVAGRAAELAGRVLEGDLARASAAARSRALGWCARAVLPEGDAREAARWVEAALELEPLGETEIAAAYVSRFAGEDGDALFSLGKTDSPTARSAFLESEFGLRDARSAVAWMRDSGLVAEDLDSDGRYLLVRSLLDLGRWDPALVVADGISERDMEETPALRFETALARLLPAVPEDLRGTIRSRPPFYPEEFHLAWETDEDEDLRAALGCFETAVALARKAGCLDLEKRWEEYALWLATDVSGSTAAPGMLGDRLRDPRPSLHLVPLAVRRGLDIDPGAVFRETEFRTALSGEFPRDAAYARLALEFANLVPGAGEAAPPSRAKLCERAGELLRELRAERLSEEVLGEMSRLVASARGGDAEKDEGTDPLFGPSEVAERLEAEGRWEELREHARESFESSRSVAAAERFARALERTGETKRLVEFARDNGDLAGKSGKMRKSFLRALYIEGELSELRAELEKDGEAAGDSEYRGLRIRLAVSSGDDPELSAAGADECLPRFAACARELSALAEISGRLGLFGSADISSAARDAVFALRAAASDAGWENDPRFRKLSATVADIGGGPLGSPCFGEGEESSARGRTEVAQRLLRGEVPVFSAARFLGKSLFGLSLLPALSNLLEKDPLRKTPVFASGLSRPPEAVPTGAVVGFDATALVTLGFLGVEDRALSAFDDVRVSRSVLEWLFEERRRIHSHFRGAAKDALAVLELLEDGTLEVLDCGSDSDDGPSADPEACFAALVAEAKKRADGVVVRTAPPPRRGVSFLAEPADLSGCAGPLVGCAAVVRKLREKECVSAAAAHGALDRLGLFETPRPDEPEIEDGASLYLDASAAGVLALMGLLGELGPAGFSPAVSRETVSRARAAVRREEISGEVLRVTDRLRMAIRSRIRSGKLKMTPDPIADGSPFGHPPATLRALARRCGAVAIDDGFFIGRGSVGERDASTRAVSTLDVLETLVSSGSVADEERRELLARLRDAGYPLPPETG